VQIRSGFLAAAHEDAQHDAQKQTDQAAGKDRLQGTEIGQHVKHDH
jgi:hypothetical protein